MAGIDVRGRRWLPPLGVALLVALTIVDVFLVTLAFRHAQGPLAAGGGRDEAGPSPSAPSTGPRASESPTPSASAAESEEPTADPDPLVPPGRVLLALAPDGTVLIGGAGTCDEPADPQLTVIRAGSDAVRPLAAVEELTAVLAVGAESRGELMVVGTDRDCAVRAYRGGAGQPWTSGPAQGEWYLDTTADPAGVHAPGGPVEVPCTPVDLSTLDAVRVLCDDGRIVGTGDVGETWVDLGRLEDATAMAFQGPSRGIALARTDDCPAAALETADGGSSWETLGCLEGETGRAVALRGDVAVAVVDDVVWHSDDGGESWESLAG